MTEKQKNEAADKAYKAWKAAHDAASKAEEFAWKLRRLEGKAWDKYYKLSHAD